MSNIAINACKSLLLIVKMLLMVMCQFVVAAIRFRLDVIIVDLKLMLTFSLSIVFLFADFFFGIGVLIGIALKQDEEQFNMVYEKHSSYFENLYNKLDNNVKQLYNFEKLMNLNINM